MPLKYDKRLTPNAKALRTEMTRQEKHLWYDFLAGYPVRFQRQKPIGAYIVDFFCQQAMLAVEVDGSQHYDPTGMAYDERRSAELSAQGVAVLRFTNPDVERNFSGVCGAILQAVEERMKERNTAEA